MNRQEKAIYINQKIKDFFNDRWVLQWTILFSLFAILTTAFPLEWLITDILLWVTFIPLSAIVIRGYHVWHSSIDYTEEEKNIKKIERLQTIAQWSLNIWVITLIIRAILKATLGIAH